MSDKDSDPDYDPDADSYTDSGYAGGSENSSVEKKRLKRLEYLLSQAGEYSNFINEKLKNKESISENTGISSRKRKAASAKSKEKAVYVEKTPSYITNATLRSYQLDALNWLLNLHDNGISGILADEMGLGKTIQTISLLGYLKHYRNNSGPYLIVVPLSTLNNWKIEFSRFCPSLNVTCLRGHIEERKAYIANEFKKTKWDVCITTYEIANREKKLLMKYPWMYLVLDEAHRIKNENTLAATVLRKIQSKYRLLLTGTPLQNTLHELWALLNFLLPDFFSNSKDFDAWFNIDSLSNNTTAREKLHAILKPFVLRRLKSEVEQSLKPKIEIQIYTGLTPMQREWYKKVLLKDETIMKTETSRMKLDSIIMHLRKVTLHPYLFAGAEKGPPYTAGNHIVENSGKMILLDKLLTKLKAQGSRVLIFSLMVRMLDILEDYCEWKNYKFCRLDGDYKPNDRQTEIEEFNKPNSDKFIFLLSTRAGGLGINLASADVVIFYDSDWNPQVDLQAMDRAHRIGQQKQVRVFRLVTENTVDERIIEIARSKLLLDHVVIQSAELTTSEKRAILHNAAEDIFSAKTFVGLDDDIDTILERGEKKTKEQTERLEKLKPKPIIQPEKVSLTIFEGENYVKKRKILKDAIENQPILTTKRRRYPTQF